MIFIDREDNVVGSKRFTRTLADRLRPFFKSILNDEEFDIFEGDLLVDSSIWIDDFTAERFMKVFHFLEQNHTPNFDDEHAMLLEWMKKDPRYSEDN